MAEIPNFSNPPVIELVLGAQFSPLTRMTSGHFGMFWQSLGPEWSKSSDGPLLEDQFESFERPLGKSPGLFDFRLQTVQIPGRFLIEHQDKDRLIQIQPTRFHLNWRKREGFYPSYRQLISEFEATYQKFVLFVESFGLGELLVNQWELTYIDAFPQGEYWQNPAEWSAVLPGLFGTLQAAENLALERRAAEWSYEITPKRGRLHIAAQPGRTADGQQQNLLLQMTARGPVGKGRAESLRAGLDLGHEVTVDTFLKVTSENAKERWKKKS